MAHITISNYFELNYKLNIYVHIYIYISIYLYIYISLYILHNTLNDTYMFVDPNTGAHTQVSKSRDV